jgi:lactoylglutathione lyase
MPFWYFFPVPQIPADVAHQSNQVELVEYPAKEGSTVNIGTPIALVENRWAVFQLNANGQGTLKKTFFDPGTSITVGDPLAVIGAEGENIPYGQSYALLEVVRMKRQKPSRKPGARRAEEGLLAPVGRIEHAAAWATDLERACAFYERWFSATRGPKYSSTNRPFKSYFLSLSSGARLELMTTPGERACLAHIAISVGSSEAVDRLVSEMKRAGVPVLSGPRLTGDRYYEAVVTDTEGNLVEITV